MKLTIVLIFATLFSSVVFAVDKKDLPKGLETGNKVGAFEAKGDDGKLWKSADVVGKDYLVVYFYPAAMTGGCTKQACAFRDHKADLKELGAQVVGVSGDEVEGLKYFKIAENLNFTLLSDADGEIAKLFGVPTKSGGEIKRTVQGKEVTLKRNVTTSRWTFIVGKNGKLIYKNTSVKAAQDSDNVITFLKAYRAKDKA
jgi:thioredoxin-dependent peroxiredoxin